MAETTTKSELAKELAKRIEVPLAYAEKAVNALLHIMQDELDAGRAIKLAGFGSFTPKLKSGRKGRNPSTGEEIFIQEHKAVKFTPAKALKEALNG